MITGERANFIAHDWVDALNQRDLERVLRIYSDSVRHTTPCVTRSGKNHFTIRGKRSLRQYFAKTMQTRRSVFFEIEGIMTGVDSFSIIYKTNNRKKGLEVMFLDEEGKVYRSFAYYN